MTKSRFFRVATLLICTFFIVPFAMQAAEKTCGGGETSPNQSLYVEFKDITEKPIEEGWKKNILPHIGSILVLLGLIIGWLNLRKQIKATRLDILKKNNLKQTSLLITNIANLLNVLRNPDNNTFLSRKEYKPGEHFIYETNVILLLDKNIPEENNLIIVLQKFLKEDVTVSSWIEDIKEKSQKVITKRLK
jgi:hypothetical protein